MIAEVGLLIEAAGKRILNPTRNALFSVLFAFLAVIPLCARAADPGVLRWTNGESISGDLVEASGTMVTWRSPLFEDPLVLSWPVIHRLDWPIPANDSEDTAPRHRSPIPMGEDSAKTTPAPDPFIISLRDGSVLYGDILAITGSSVSIHSARCGDGELMRSQVLSVRRMNGSALLFAGPTGDAAWQPLSGRGGTDQEKVPAFVAGPGGGLQIPYLNRGVFLNSAIPDSVDVEFHLHTTGHPAFQFTIEGDRIAVSGTAAAAQPAAPTPSAPPMHLTLNGKNVVRLTSTEGRPGTGQRRSSASKSGLRIETWGDEMVLTVPDDFKLIRKIGDGEHDIALRICWDRVKRHCWIYTPAGELITEWQPPDSGWNDHPGTVQLHNSSSNLTLDFLRLRKWDGVPPPKIDPAQPRLELDDNRVLAGQITSGSGGSVQLAGQQEPIPLKDIDALVFSPDSPKEAPAQARLIFSDGGWLQGQLPEIKNGIASIATTFTSHPLAARLDGLRRMLVDTSAPPQSGSLAGYAGAENSGSSVSSSSSSSSSVSQSGSGASPSIRNPQSEIGNTTDVLSFSAPGQGQATSGNFPTTFHGVLTMAGDDAPRWTPVGGGTSVIPSRSIPYQVSRHFADDANFTTAPALFYTRSGDVLPGILHAIDRTGVELESPIVQTRKLPAGDLRAIQFGASGRLSLHGFNDPGWRILTGADSKVIRAGDSLELQAGASIGHPGAMQCDEMRFTMATDGFSAIRFRMYCAGDNTANCVKLLMAGINGEFACGAEGTEGQFDDAGLRVRIPSGSVNVRLVFTQDSLDIRLNGVSMMEVAIPPTGRAGAGLIIEPAGIWGNSVTPAKISDFSSFSEPGSTSVPDVPDDAKSQTLTVPRFRRDDPPIHVLIAANGDLLRGEVDGATNSSFSFRTGLEELVVPRDRVRAVIWLGKPEDVPAAPAKKNPSLQLLQQRINGGITFGGGNLSTFTNYLQNNVGLKFEIPDNIGNDNSSSFHMGNEPVSAALDRLSQRYGLTYHLDDRGVVVFEISTPAVPMDDKVYWLKPGSFPANIPADKVLADKGITFLRGSMAAWDPDSSQLRMKNTAENQAKLAQLIASDYGVALAAPTHWLLLTSGARLALTMEKFNKDAVIGRHPIYGRCTIPTADIVSIRTSPMDPSAVMKVVDGWHLVFAPEPVLPEAGGESSALLGKVAPDFKIPLLAGGQFQLSDQKGKVVVLDFWATWCGPCVHSLPALIQAMSAFSPDRVTFIGIDENEPAAQVKQFLETRGWNLNAALDDAAQVGQKYGVDAIPQTVIIAPDGKVAWVNTGYTADEETDVAKTVTQLLSPGH